MSASIRRARPGELDVILELLRQERLPVDGVREHLGGFLVAEEDGALLGAVGLEMYNGVGLLRSLAVAPGERGAGLGRRLVDAVLARSRGENLEAVYLLTTTAQGYFPRFGFETIPREEMDPRLSPSRELQGACPLSAVCMRLRF